jgi:TorA maturation chaperone TorD
MNQLTDHHSFATAGLAGARSSRSPDARADLWRALGIMAEAPGSEHPRLADLLGLPAPLGTEWTEAFVVQLVPHASIYLSSDGMLGGEAADRVAGFWRALRIPVPADPDHLTALLGLYASLVDRHAAESDGARRALLGRARAALLHEHLLSWLPAYALAMVDVGPPAYAAWAGLVREALRAEAAEVGAPDRLPVHLAAASPTAEPADGLDAVLRALLGPARSGLVLARGHLAGLARDARLGLRLGDRSQVLRALMEQDATTVSTLLADQAEAWARRHRADAPMTGPAARHWADRASATATLLRARKETHDDHAPAQHRTVAGDRGRRAPDRA